MSRFNVSEVFGFLPDYLDHCTNDTFACDEALPPCASSRGMHFPSVWTITQNYHGLCAAQGKWLHDAGPRLDENKLGLTREACHAIAGNGWTQYSKADIWSRLTTWKFPLIQLIASAPRPPLSFWVESLTVLHLAADPIGSLTDLMFKLDSCQRRTVFWGIHLQELGLLSSCSAKPQDRERLCKALAIITESYSELDYRCAEEAEVVLLDQIRLPVFPRQTMAKGFLRECMTTAEALAADRATTFLPVIIAEAIFISIFFIDIIRLQSDNLARATSTTFVNIEMYSIGFSALFFWMISAVIIMAVVGASQTAGAIPRILKRLQKDLAAAGINISLPDPLSSAQQIDKRWSHGGLYTWQPLQRHRLRSIRQNARAELKHIKTHSGWTKFLRRLLLRVWPIVYLVLPAIIFVCSIATGTLMSAFVPPKGWTCRSLGEFYFAIGWAVSYLGSVAIVRLPEKFWFATLFCKDLAVTIAAAAWILVTQMGVYNRCDCYVGHDSGLVLPEQPKTYAQLQAGLRIGGSFVTILVLGIVMQVVIVPCLLWLRYGLAISVFLQKDSDGCKLLEGLQQPEQMAKSVPEVETREMVVVATEPAPT